MGGIDCKCSQREMEAQRVVECAEMVWSQPANDVTDAIYGHRSNLFRLRL